MKRSEMIIEICKLLEAQSRQGTAYAYKAEEILAMLEKADMLPPQVQLLHERDLVEDLNVSFYKTECKWEPEDEVK